MNVNPAAPSGGMSVSHESSDFQGVRRTSEEISKAVQTEQPYDAAVQSAEQPSSSGATAQAAQANGSSLGGNIDEMA